MQPYFLIYFMRAIKLPHDLRVNLWQQTHLIVFVWLSPNSQYTSSNPQVGLTLISIKIVHPPFIIGPLS